GPRWLVGQLQAPVAEVLRRAVGRTGFVAGRAVPREQAQILPLQEDACGSLRLREGVREAARSRDQVLRADALDDQLRELGHREPRIVAARRRRRWLHRTGLDGHCADAELL